MKQTFKPVYGQCPCGGVYENRTIDVNIRAGDRTITLKNISQGACPLCGSRVYKTALLERIESVMKQAQIADKGYNPSG